ncbi:carboxypeptidase-like regulatory domain-containing protein [Seonamhaeicola sp. MEBiC1930]|uniref:carboxypeptidase-like regulatory domain-containing protein n=1 Tax=Seonamhaeicola sp. MEBiC01930 TaxID=2976768 RepID=UPI00324FFD76
MKHLVAIFFILFSASVFAQDTGLIVGKVLDKDANNMPLAFANVSIKGTSTNVSSDVSGLFLLENLKAGEYTLVCNFPGYETKELSITVDALEPAEIRLELGSFTMPMPLTASIDSSSKASVLQATSTSLN